MQEANFEPCDILAVTFRRVQESPNKLFLVCPRDKIIALSAEERLIRHSDFPASGTVSSKTAREFAPVQ